MKKKSWYAVRQGRKTGLYTTWEECKKHWYKNISLFDVLSVAPTKSIFKSFDMLLFISIYHRHNAFKLYLL